MPNHKNKHALFLLILLVSLSACSTANIQPSAKSETFTITVYGSVFSGFDHLEKKLRKESAKLCGSDTFTILEDDVIDTQEIIYYENLKKYARVLNITRKIECR